MNKTEHRASDALPLALAAARLGISPDALRMRINRGKIRGFKKGGRLFAVLDEAPNQAQKTAHLGTEQTTPGRFEQLRDRSASFRGPSLGPGPGRGDSSRRPAAPDPGEPSLPLVVEFQKVELSRLLRDNSRLNQRLDQLFEELRHLREMQQREQVLRQQDQALRQRSQALIERLTAPPAAAPIPASSPLVSTVPAPAPPMSAPPMSARSMRRPPISSPPVSDPPVSDPPMSHVPGPEAAGPENAPVFPDAGSLESALGSESAAPGDVPGDHTAKAGGGGGPPELHRPELHRPDLHQEDPAQAYEEDAMPPASPPGPPPGPPLGPPLGPLGESGASWDGARRDAAELADMLKEIGTSLRGLDSAATDAAATTAPSQPRPDLPQTGPEPPPVPAARRTPGDLAGAPSGPPSGAPVDDEAGLLEILGRMGPSAEERRTAARLMKRLFKGRAARRRGKPGDDAD